jgi:hypothetical protein
MRFILSKKNGQENALGLVGKAFGALFPNYNNNI